MRSTSVVVSLLSLLAATALAGTESQQSIDARTIWILQSAQPPQDSHQGGPGQFGHNQDQFGQGPRDHDQYGGGPPGQYGGGPPRHGDKHRHDDDDGSNYGVALRRNGTWPDIGLWRKRPEGANSPPTRFRAVAVNMVADKVHYELHNADCAGEKLAYVEGSKNPVQGLSAFVLVKEPKTSEIVDQWTITVDDEGRMLLGYADEDADRSGDAWIQLGPNWCNIRRGDCAPDEFCTIGYCDGMSFRLCGEADRCFGIPSRIELLQSTT